MTTRGRFSIRRAGARGLQVVTEAMGRSGFRDRLRKMPPQKKSMAVLSVTNVTDRTGTFSTAGTKAKPGARLTSWRVAFVKDVWEPWVAGAPPASLLHTYLSPGTFTATLTIKDSTGVEISTTAEIAILAQTPAPVPEPVPEPTPTPTPLPTGRQLLGGWRLAQEFPRGAIAIDFATMKCWLAGHQQRQEIVEYQLPAMGTGTDLNAWPAVQPTRIIPGWWPAERGNAYALCFWRGKVWVSPRVYYAQPPYVYSDLVLYASDGETVTVPLPEQAFSGFVKRGPGIDPFIGGGGYDSGQGTQSGPSLGTLAGQRLIQYGWPLDPGANLEHWNERAPREPNYWPVGHIDSWVAWEPRTVNGVREGRWASDGIRGGGLVLPEGITYWPVMGLDDLDYSRQSLCFAAADKLRTYAYRYDPNTYQLLGYEPRPEFGISVVCGQELDANGRVYLAHSDQWASGPYQVDVAVKVFG